MSGSDSNIMGEPPASSLSKTRTQQNTTNTYNSLTSNPNSKPIPNTPTSQYSYKKHTSLKQQKLTLFLTKKPVTHIHSTTQNQKKSEPSSALKDNKSAKKQVKKIFEIF